MEAEKEVIPQAADKKDKKFAGKFIRFLKVKKQKSL